MRWLRIISLFFKYSFAWIVCGTTNLSPGDDTNCAFNNYGWSREGIPFPAAIEAFLMTLMLELIKESGIRLPRAVGSAVSIVGGALVLGQAAVEAGIVSAPMVIVVAATAIAEFAVPALTEAVIIYRFILIILGGFMGLYTMTCGLIIITIHILSLNSFDVPYGFPLAPPKTNKGLKILLLDIHYGPLSLDLKL